MAGRTTSTGRSRAIVTGVRRYRSGSAMRTTRTSKRSEAIAALEQRNGEPCGDGFDPHKPYIDRYTWGCAKCGGTMRRVPQVIDTWFDSGSMPFAQWHFPFENREQVRSATIRRISSPKESTRRAAGSIRCWRSRPDLATRFHTIRLRTSARRLQDGVLYCAVQRRRRQRSRARRRRAENVEEHGERRRSGSCDSALRCRRSASVSRRFEPGLDAEPVRRELRFATRPGDSC